MAKPSQKIIDSYRDRIRERGITIKYCHFRDDDSLRDKVTGEPIYESMVYDDPIELQAWIEEQPGKHRKEAFGLKEERFIVVEVHRDELLDQNIVLHIGDKFEYEKTTYFLQKAPQKTGQVKDGHVLVLLALEFVEGKSEVVE